MQHLKVRFYH